MHEEVNKSSRRKGVCKVITMRDWLCTTKQCVKPAYFVSLGLKW